LFGGDVGSFKEGCGEFRRRRRILRRAAGGEINNLTTVGKIAI
jgi:hypothetical protein